MISFLRAAVLASWSACALLAPAAAETASDLAARGLEARQDGRFADAVQALEAALALTPEDVDARVQLGFARLALGETDRARAEFERVLREAPDYADADLGLAQIALRGGDLAQARWRVDALLAREAARPDLRLLDGRVALREGDLARAGQAFAAVLAGEPDSAEALAGAGDVRAARGDARGARAAYAAALAADPASEEIRARLAAPLPRAWRLDLGGEASALTAGRGTWTDASLGLARRFEQRTTLSLRTRSATRFGRDDLQVEARLDRDISLSLSAYAQGALAPDADFLARRSFGLGASLRIGPVQEARPGQVTAGFDLRRDDFAASEVMTVSPWVQVPLAGDRLSLTGRWVRSEDDEGMVAAGWSARLDGLVSDRLGWRAAYADVPEITAGSLAETRTLSAGLSFEVSPDLTLRADIAHERRDAFDRATLALGAAIRF